MEFLNLILCQQRRRIFIFDTILCNDSSPLVNKVWLCVATKSTLCCLEAFSCFTLHIFPLFSYFEVFSRLAYYLRVFAIGL